MDTSGNIYDLVQDQKPKPGHFKLDKEEHKILQAIAKEERVMRLKQIRTEKQMTIPRRPRSVLPKSLRKAIDVR